MNPKSIRRTSALIGAGVLTIGGVAFAATVPDDLPEQAQVGENAATRTPTQAGQDDEVAGGQDAHAPVQADLASGHVTTENDPEANDHGQTVSTSARDTDLEGRDKGQAVAEHASANRADVTSDEATDNAPVANDVPDEHDGSRETGEQASDEGQARAGDDR